MLPEILNKLEEYRDKYFNPNMTVLEVGSRNVNGSPRFLFEGYDYTGVDLEAGDGVDIVGEYPNIPHDLRRDIVLCLETIEHVNLLEGFLHCLQFDTIQYLVVSSPYLHSNYHAHPKDYWRLTEDAYREIVFEDMEILDLSIMGNKEWSTIMGIARRI